MTAIEAVDYLMNAYIEDPVEEWGKIMTKADIPTRHLSIAAFVSTILIIIIPEDLLTKMAIPMIMDEMSGSFL